MSKTPTSAIGIDLGRHSLKSVLLQRRGANRFVITHYASRVLETPIDTPERLQAEVSQLLKAQGGSAKVSCVALSESDSLIRIIEQPETPPTILRDALRLNGMALLNQECRDFVLDCALIPSTEQDGSGKRKYLVAGVPRPRISQLNEAFHKSPAPLRAIQMGPICLFNAFEFAHAEVFNHEAFILVDIGHSSSTVIVGCKGEINLVRAIDSGGASLLEAFAGSDPEDQQHQLRILESGDDAARDNMRFALIALTREISSSIGFFEGRREETISRIFVSGGAARSARVLGILTSELHLPCRSWNPFERCENGLSEKQKAGFAEEAVTLGVACGAAAEMLKGN